MWNTQMCRELLGGGGKKIPHIGIGCTHLDSFAAHPKIGSKSLKALLWEGGKGEARQSHGFAKIVKSLS